MESSVVLKPFYNFDETDLACAQDHLRELYSDMHEEQKQSAKRTLKRRERKQRWLRRQSNARASSYVINTEVGKGRRVIKINSSDDESMQIHTLLNEMSLEDQKQNRKSEVSNDSNFISIAASEEDIGMQPIVIPVTATPPKFEQKITEKRRAPSPQEPRYKRARVSPRPDDVYQIINTSKLRRGLTELLERAREALKHNMLNEKRRKIAICYYHNKFGILAKKCREPCKFKK